MTVRSPGVQPRQSAALDRGAPPIGAARHIGLFAHEWKDFERLTSEAGLLTNQERFFFAWRANAWEQGVTSERMLRDGMQRHHVPHEALEVVKRTPPLAA